MSSPEELLLLSLPNELLLSCIARVSRLYYPTLSLVSKYFRSLIASPELEKYRSLLDITDRCLYVCLNIADGYHLFTLRWKPDKFVTNDKKSGGYVLATVPSPHSPKPFVLVAVGSNIYSIKDYYSPTPSSVSILDCRFHTWREAPIIRDDLLHLTACVVDQNIYVAGRYIGDVGLKNAVAVLDTETLIWDYVPDNSSEILGNKFFRISACIDGKFHLLTGRGVAAYSSKERSWDKIGQPFNLWNIMFSSHACCEIEKVLYYGNLRNFGWYDSEVGIWRDLKGLVGLPKFPGSSTLVRFADYGGKMAIFWDEDAPCCDESGIVKETMIWCAVIALEKRNSCEIWGIVEWFDHVLTVPSPCRVMSVVAAIV